MTYSSFRKWKLTHMLTGEPQRVMPVVILC
nr:MAG TPA: hypothetical protein [Caudoviricetes sp.]